eukprot:TRINITY_DN2315_c0_g3_i1.p1 TRINITY_DN2315_c0_g3~~TRINITY_DN2315_c0_g3_i1.p1  ORF type:complete len:170 (-),score=35.69 TRINITY_DN2315_c0_g3_i1:127-636(-)
MPTWTRKKYIRLAKGFYGRNKNTMRTMAPRVERALCFAYRDRKTKRRLYREGWIISINAAVREHDINYSRFVNCLNNSNIQLDRKILADLAQNEPYTFKAIVDEVKFQNHWQDPLRPTVTYHDALAKGLLVQAPLDAAKHVEKPDKLPYFGIRFEDQKTPEEIAEIKRQ